MTEATGLFGDLNFRLRRASWPPGRRTASARQSPSASTRMARASCWLTLKRPARRHRRAPRCGRHTFDQSDPRVVERLAHAAGEIDILFNNAGILVAKPPLETSLADVRRRVDTALVGVIRLRQLVGRGLVARRRGVIVSIGSHTAFAGGENRAVYAVAKAAISQLTRAAAFAGFGAFPWVAGARPRRSASWCCHETLIADGGCVIG
jgi:NAD(P)-dependent dehydrogenase (short-subunit alcohol dehydrogenase family)